MNVFTKFDEIPSMILKVIKETKRYRQTVGRTDGWSDVKKVYPPTNTVCRGYKNVLNPRRDGRTDKAETNMLPTFSKLGA